MYMNFNQYFQKVFDKKNLLKEEAERAFNLIMSAKVSNIEIASFLVTLSLLVFIGVIIFS